ncbi:glycosyltransferase [Kineosporia succinea]|uniref:Glycosyltransferase involved in cell wall biosynthesis/GT2 family glycosyltransferase n=1 Tax=Kineosporia succinea TaxID=84632 RepID=A0ABT9PEE6_9ACTN|nr:glycosyltransferase [Kineosporia succinea]MDP9831063.1 glycosyltransferase involved in cell wall biosynthesis/GT2 family glycosyltransferase [Kineosporia succinea]
MPESVLWCVSFDGTPLSGVVVESLKLADAFRQRGHRVLLDVGYDIKEDKGRFFAPYTDEADGLPPWVELVRVDGLDSIPWYNPAFVASTLRAVRFGTPLQGCFDVVVEALARRIEATWRRHGVTAVLVGNGTLPENIAYTRALYRAIDRYGPAIGRPFVLWHDHDLMWTSEPSSGKYGSPPYPLAPKPLNSPYIRYLALHEDARRRTLEWVPDLRDLRVLHNTFDFERSAVGIGFREAHGIPAEAALIARCTRLIPQKRADREIDLIAALRHRIHDRPVYLFLAGDPTEHPPTVAALEEQARRLGVSDRVIFGGRLAPRDLDVPHAFSVADLLAEADLMSFLTSYDYESYGNPIGEAIASGVPYLTTRYALYDTVYGRKGLHAPVLEVSSQDEAPLTPEFLADVVELLTNPRLHSRVSAHNRARGERYFGRSRAAETVDDLLTGVVTAPVWAGDTVPPLEAGTRMTVVLPVKDEAANLPAVIEGLAGQTGPGGPLDRGLFDILLVDNNSRDETVSLARELASRHEGLRLWVIHESEQGVSCARRTGMDLAAARAAERDGDDATRRFYLVSADADCRVAPDWLWELLSAMDGEKAAIGVCDYYYDAAHFAGRPLLWEAIDRTIRSRRVAWSRFGGFPDGKGFAVDRRSYQRVGGIELSYQMENGRLVSHLSDDWDFGILVRATGEDIVYVPGSRVEINPRRVDHAIDEVVAGRAYGSGGIITMRDIRPTESMRPGGRDLTEAEAVQAWEFSIKDFMPKNMILAAVLTPSLLDDEGVIDLLSPGLARRMAARIPEITADTHLHSYLPIHSYKTPCFRLYFEFAEELFARLRAKVGPDIGYPPPLPDCLQEVRDTGDEDRFREMVRQYCEDRESGEAHDYFGNGGVF